MLQNSKTKTVTKVTNLNCNKTEKLEFGQNSTQSMKNFKTQTVTKFNNSNCDKTQQLKLRQNSKTQILSKRTISDKSLLLKTTWHLENLWDIFEAVICNLAMFLLFK